MAGTVRSHLGIRPLPRISPTLNLTPNMPPRSKGPLKGRNPLILMSSTYERVCVLNVEHTGCVLKIVCAQFVFRLFFLFAVCNEWMEFRDNCFVKVIVYPS